VHFAAGSQISPLHFVAGSQISLLHFAAGSQNFPLHDAAASQILPLHDAAGSQILLLHDAAKSQFGSGESIKSKNSGRLPRPLKGQSCKKKSYMGDLQYPSPMRIMY
jgi:hypothetical protein